MAIAFAYYEDCVLNLFEHAYRPRQARRRIPSEVFKTTAYNMATITGNDVPVPSLTEAVIAL